MSRLRSLLTGSACIALTGCTFINPIQPKASAQPPANTQFGAVHFFAEAQNLEQQQRFSEAAELYTKAIELSPESRECYESLIRIHLGLDQLELAEKDAILYQQQFPDDIEPQLLQAAVFTRQNELAKAEALYREASNRFPKNEEVLLGLNLTLGKLNRFNEAANLLDQKLSESDHWSANVYALRAEIALMSSAETETEQIEFIRQSLAFLNTATTKAPERAKLWLRKSELERALKDYPAATLSLETLQKLTPDNPQIGQVLIPLYLQQEAYDKIYPLLSQLAEQENDQVVELIGISARHALATDKPQEAVKLAEEGALLLPDQRDAQFLHSYMLIQTKQFVKAEALLEKIRTKLYTEQPNSFDPRLELYFGIALLQQHKIADATEVFTELAAQQFDANISDYLQLLLSWNDTETLPLLAEVLHNAEQEITESAYLPYFRALILQQNKEYPAAIEAFKAAENNALNLGENQDPVLNDQFYFLFASAYERCQQYDEATTHFRKAISINPKRADAMNYLAYMWAENNTNLNEAQQLIDQALAMSPEIGAFIDTLGWIYYQQGQYEKAFEQLSRAAELESNDPAVLDHLGDCALKLAQPQDARKYWLESLKIEANPVIQAKLDALPSE